MKKILLSVVALTAFASGVFAQDTACINDGLGCEDSYKFLNDSKKRYELSYKCNDNYFSNYDSKYFGTNKKGIDYCSTIVEKTQKEIEDLAVDYKTKQTIGDSIAVYGTGAILAPVTGGISLAVASALHLYSFVFLGSPDPLAPVAVALD